MGAWSAARPLASESLGPRSFCRADPGNNLAAGRPDLTNAHVVFGVVLDRLTLPALPALRGQRVILRGSRESDIDDRLRHPIDPGEEDGYGSAWRREWDGRRYHTREHLTAARGPLNSSAYRWAVEYDSHCIGSAGLHVDTGQHCASYTVGLFVAALRGRGLGREVTRLVLSWGFDVLGLHRIQLEVLAGNSRAINCYLACGFRQEGVRRGAELYPDGWKDLILMGVLWPEYAAEVKTRPSDLVVDQTVRRPGVQALGRHRTRRLPPRQVASASPGSDQDPSAARMPISPDAGRRAVEGPHDR